MSQTNNKKTLILYIVIVLFQFPYSFVEGESANTISSRDTNTKNIIHPSSSAYNLVGVIILASIIALTIISAIFYIIYNLNVRVTGKTHFIAHIKYLFGKPSEE